MVEKGFKDILFTRISWSPLQYHKSNNLPNQARVPEPLIPSINTTFSYVRRHPKPGLTAVTTAVILKLCFRKLASTHFSLLFLVLHSFQCSNLSG